MTKLSFGETTLDVELPAPTDSYFAIAETETRVVGEMWFVVSIAYHVKDDSCVFGRLHRIGKDGRVLWTSTPDPNVEGCFVLQTTTGVVVVAPWGEDERAAGDPPTLVARLVDPDTGAVRASHRIETKRNEARTTARVSFALRTRRTHRGGLMIEIRPNVAWPSIAVAFAAESPEATDALPIAFGVPL